MATLQLTIHEARDVALQALRRVGLCDLDAEVATDHLIMAEMRGYPSHGLRRIPSIASAISAVGETGEIVAKVRKPGFVLFDGSSRLGIAAVANALETTSRQLNHDAATIVSVINYTGTTGSLGVYSEVLAAKGIASILMCSSEFAVAPHGSARAILGTNPIAFGLPAEPVSFCADIATAAASYGSIKDAAIAGQSLPTGVVQTSTGHPSTDPNDADNGSILPMAGHKGYALGLAVELFCGPLIGGKAGREAVLGSDGFFGVLIRSDAARASEAVNTDAQALFSEILNSPRREGIPELRIPGDQASRRHRIAAYIEVRQELLDTLRSLGR